MMIRWREIKKMKSCHPINSMKRFNVMKWNKKSRLTVDICCLIIDHLFQLKFHKNGNKIRFDWMETDNWCIQYPLHCLLTTQKKTVTVSHKEDNGFHWFFSRMVSFLRALEKNSLCIKQKKEKTLFRVIVAHSVFVFFFF